MRSYEHTGGSSMLQNRLLRWHIIRVSEIVTDVQPGVPSTERKVLELIVHDVKGIFKTPQKEILLPDCYSANYSSSLTKRAGRWKFSRTKNAARQKLVREEPALHFDPAWEHKPDDCPVLELML